MAVLANYAVIDSYTENKQAEIDRGKILYAKDDA